MIQFIPTFLSRYREDRPHPDRVTSSSAHSSSKDRVVEAAVRDKDMQLELMAQIMDMLGKKTGVLGPSDSSSSRAQPPPSSSARPKSPLSLLLEGGINRPNPRY